MRQLQSEQLQLSRAVWQPEFEPPGRKLTMRRRRMRRKRLKMKRTKRRRRRRSLMMKTRK